jgi:hypothetical protein
MTKLTVAFRSFANAPRKKANRLERGQKHSRTELFQCIRDTWVADGVHTSDLHVVIKASTSAQRKSMIHVCSHEATAFFTLASTAIGTKGMEITACEIKTFGRVVHSLPAVTGRKSGCSLWLGVTTYHDEALAKQPKPCATSSLE